MGKIAELYQSADWKAEKHVPVIECSDHVKKDELFDVRVTLGKEIAHPNTTEHHIRWIQLFFKPEGDKFAYQVANCEFSAHGATVDGPNKGSLYTHHGATVGAMVKKSGTLYAMSLCNIHGLWENQKAIQVK